MPTGTKSTREFVASIRAFAIAHPDMSPMKIADTLGINMHHSNLYRIIYNRVFYDPLYTAPAHAGWKNRIKTVRIVNVKPNGKTCRARSYYQGNSSASQARNQPKHNGKYRDQYHAS
jgi:hypothetical protein